MTSAHAQSAQENPAAPWQDDASRDLTRNVGDRLALFVRGEGAYLWDGAGRRYLDFLAGIAVVSLGHAHPVFVEAVSRQAATLAHVSNYFATPPQLALAAQLKRLAATVRAHRDGILEHFRSGLSNGFIEAMNAQIQAAKARAAGDERKAKQADQQAAQWEEWLKAAENAVEG